MFLRAFPILLLALVFAGCGPDARQLQYEDDRNPYIKNAIALAQDQDYAAAIESYEKALAANPKLAQVHYEMGLLYNDKLSDPIAAMYHFSRFLKLAPDSPNASAVQAHLNSAQIQFAVTLPNSPVQNAEAFAKLQSDNQELARARDEAQRRVAELEAKFSEPPALAQSSSPTNTALTTLPLEPVTAVTPTRPPRPPVIEIPSLAPDLVGGKPVRVLEKVPKSQPPVVDAEPIPEPVAPTPFVPKPVPAAPTARTGVHTYTVQKGDSLWKISSKFYPGQVKEGIERLRAANPGPLAEGKPLKPGQVLSVP